MLYVRRDLSVHFDVMLGALYAKCIVSQWSLILVDAICGRLLLQQTSHAVVARVVCC